MYSETSAQSQIPQTASHLAKMDSEESQVLSFDCSAVVAIVLDLLHLVAGRRTLGQSFVGEVSLLILKDS